MFRTLVLLAAPGPKFDLRRDNDTVLATGAVAPAAPESRIDGWLAAQAAR